VHGHTTQVLQDGVNLRGEGLAAWGRTGKLIATLLALLLGLAGRRAIADDAVTLTFGACLHQCFPPAGVILQSARGISQSSHENTITIWLKPSSRYIKRWKFYHAIVHAGTICTLLRMQTACKGICLGMVMPWQAPRGMKMGSLPCATLFPCLSGRMGPPRAGAEVVSYWCHELV
jgi:hypothetical protein